MASDSFYRMRINAAFFRAMHAGDERACQQAMVRLSTRLTQIIERAAHRDDENIKVYARKNKGQQRSHDPFSRHNQILARNNLVIGNIMDVAKEAASRSGTIMKPFIPA